MDASWNKLSTTAIDLTLSLAVLKAFLNEIVDEIISNQLVDTNVHEYIKKINPKYWMYFWLSLSYINSFELKIIKMGSKQTHMLA